MSEIERRALMKGAALSALAFSVGGAQVLLSPRQAHAQNIPYRTLSPQQVEILEVLGETLVPARPLPAFRISSINNSRSP